MVAKLREQAAATSSCREAQSTIFGEKDDVDRLFDAARPQVVIHLAAVVGGIGANRTHPGRFFYDNAMMGLQMIEGARRHGLEKFVCVGTVCSYPKFTPVPFREENILERLSRGDQRALRAGEEDAAGATRSRTGRSMGFRHHLIPVNLYGPRDNFDLETGHVIPALIPNVSKPSAPARRNWWYGNGPSDA